MGSYQARTEQLVVEELDGGVMVYDTRSHEAHWLDQTAAAVWRACADGADAVQIARVTGREVRSVELALGRLMDVGLVAPTGVGVSRRTVLRTAAKVGVAGVAAAPIVSAVIPVAAAHASTGGTGGGPPPPQNYSYTIKSGPGTSGSVDAQNLASTSNPPAGAAYNIPLVTGAWITPISGTGWINIEPDNTGPADPRRGRITTRLARR